MMKMRARVTIQDVAREAGVTKVAVSQALSGKGRISESTRRKIESIAQQMQYEPNLHARSLSNGRSDVISLFACHLYPGAFSQKIEAIQLRLSEHGYDVPLHGYGFRVATPQSQAKIIDGLRTQRPRAIVCSGDSLTPIIIRELKRYQDEGGLIVSYGWGVDLECDQVVFDYGNSIAQATRHLLELGHSRVGLFNPGVHDKEDNGVRLSSFKNALNESKVPLNNEWIFDGTTFEEGGVQLAQQYLSLSLKNRPTGLCIVNDSSASTFINVLMRAGIRVPEDVSVVGQDDTIHARYAVVPLTTVSHPVERIADEVVAMLLSRIENGYDGAPRRVTVQGELIVRESSGAPEK